VLRFVCRIRTHPERCDGRYRAYGQCGDSPVVWTGWSRRGLRADERKPRSEDRSALSHPGSQRLKVPTTPRQMSIVVALTSVGAPAFVALDSSTPISAQALRKSATSPAAASHASATALASAPCLVSIAAILRWDCR